MIRKQGWTRLHRHCGLSGELNGLLDYFNDVRAAHHSPETAGPPVP
jgi:hypothetical protein